MPDGSLIQERDPLTVPSTRRNPVLADVFNRLGYMERKGSGFGKILSGYEFQVNYTEDKKPSFRSDRYQFTVVMPNLNYDEGISRENTGVEHVTQDVTQSKKIYVCEHEEKNKIESRIIEMIRTDNKISTEKIATALGISSRTVKRHIKMMPNIQFIGRGFSGHWEIKEDK